MKNNIETAIYSGSFNPIHYGHKMIIKAIAEKFEKVRVIVTPQNPLKDSSVRENYEDRLNKVRFAINEELKLENVIIDGIEYELESPNYTYRTLCELKKRHKDETHTLIVGGDCLKDLDKWKNWKEIVSEFGILAIRRKGYDEDEYVNRLSGILGYDVIGNGICIEDFGIPKISSTEIRKNFEN